MTSEGSRAVDAWLDAFAACVRTGEMASARRLFAEDATGFGTVAASYDSLDDLVATQWSDVWPRTADFTFDAVHGHWQDADLAVVAATWSSTGTDTGSPRHRTGRVTLVLERRDAGLVAVHSHFSMTPGTPA